MSKRATAVDFEISKRIKALRIKAGLTQEKLAEKMGLTFQQMQKYETGKNRVAGSRFMDLSKHLKVPVATFFGQDNQAGEVFVDTRINSPLRQDIISLLDRVNTKAMENNIYGIISLVVDKKWAFRKRNGNYTATRVKAGSR
jgi:transcriptional regulator with XRE-family HTH domain